MRAEDEPPSSELLAYLRTLAGTPKPGQFFDVRWCLPASPMRRRFVSALRLHDAARLIIRLARGSDVYVGVALRDGSAHGGKSAIGGSHLLYIECDDPAAAARLAGLQFPPTMEVASGSPGGLQLYWRLSERAPSLEVESANRRLALALGGDPACVDIARILRPPQSFNHKHDPPADVVLLVLREGARYTLAQLTHGLPEDPRPQASEGERLVRRRPARSRLDRELLAIPARDYVRILTGRSANASGKVLCPFHSETDPSLQLYADGTFYCFGSGCGRGGTIVDFAAHLWDITPRGAEFIDLRKRLAERLDLKDAPCS